MSLVIRVTPQVTTIQMPASGTLLTAPERDDIVPFSFLPLKAEGQNDRKLEDIDAKKECHYRLGRIDPAVARIADEIDSASARIARFVGEASGFSKAARRNPLVPVSQAPVFEVRADQIDSQMVSLLWNDQMRDLAGPLVPGEPIASVETRIEGTLTSAQFAFAAALIGIRVGDAVRIGTRALAKKLRSEHGIGTPEVANPSALYEVVRINDPILYGQHVLAAPIESIQTYLESYWNAAERYWTAVEKTGLYDHDDVVFLKALGIADGDAEPSPFPLVFEKKTQAANASGIADAERIAWMSKVERFKEDVRILSAICNRVTQYFMSGWPAEAQNMLSDERSTWVANQTVAELGLPPDRAAGHRIDALRLLPLYSSFFDLEIEELNKIVEYADGKKEYVPPKIKAILTTPNLWANVADVVVNHLIATQWEMRVPGVLGHLTLRPAYIASDEAWKVDMGTNIGFGDGAGILYNLYLDPYRYDLYLSDLSKWRQELESNLSRTSRREPGQRFAAMARYYFIQFEEFRVALAAANRSNDLRAAYFAINERLGYADAYFHDTGRIVLPHDSIVTAVYASVGEYVEERRPIFSLEHRYRRNADLAVDPSTALDADLAVGGVYLVTGDRLAGEKIAWTLAIKSVRVTDGGLLAFSAEIFPVVAVASLAEGVRNVPEYLPLSDRYSASDYSLVSPETCAMASAALPRMGSIDVDIERRLY